MRSSYYYQGHYEQVATAIRKYINSLDDFLSPQTAGSPRAVGDALESLVVERFETFLGDWCSEYSSEFSRRPTADVAYTDMALRFYEWVACFWKPSGYRSSPPR